MCNCGGNSNQSSRPQAKTQQYGSPRISQRPPMTVYNTPSYAPPTPHYPDQPYYPYY